MTRHQVTSHADVTITLPEESELERKKGESLRQNDVCQKTGKCREQLANFLVAVVPGCEMRADDVNSSKLGPRETEETALGISLNRHTLLSKKGMSNTSTYQHGD